MTEAEGQSFSLEQPQTDALGIAASLHGLRMGKPNAIFQHNALVPVGYGLGFAEFGGVVSTAPLAGLAVLRTIARRYFSTAVLMLRATASR